MRRLAVYIGGNDGLGKRGREMVFKRLYLGHTRANTDDALNRIVLAPHALRLRDNPACGVVCQNGPIAESWSVIELHGFEQLRGR